MYNLTHTYKRRWFGYVRRTHSVQELVPKPPNQDSSQPNDRFVDKRHLFPRTQKLSEPQCCHSWTEPKTNI